MITEIKSVNNKLVADTVKLGDKKHRAASGLYLVEGTRMVSDAIKYNAPIKYIFADKKSPFLNILDDAKYSVYTAETYIIDKMSAAKSPQGILAAVRIPDNDPRPPKGSAVVLDAIQDPGNAGAIMRAALAVGITDVYLIDCADAYNPKTVKSSMSAIFNVTCHEGRVDDILPLLTKQKDLQLLCADGRGENIFKAAKPKRFALVVGNEGRGVRAEIKSKCAKTYSLPMDARVESLNAAVATGILLYMLKEV